MWVAGGIGITPFLSVLRSMEPGHGSTVKLYYCACTAAEAVFLDELTVHAGGAGDVTVLPVNSEDGLWLDAETKPLVAAVTAGPVGHGVSDRRIHTGEFEFR